jgi:hypothetical protein
VRALAVLILVLAACASPTEAEPSATTEPSADPTSTARPTPTARPTETAEPAPSSTPSAGGSGSARYTIAGDYSATGELAFVPSSSDSSQTGPRQLVFCSGSCTSADSSAFLVMEFEPSGAFVSFDNPEALVTGLCEVDFTRQDETAVAATFTCAPDQAFRLAAQGGVCAWTAYLNGTTRVTRTESCAPIGITTISGSFDANLP